MSTTEIILTIIPLVLTAVIGIIGWLLRDKLNALVKTDDRLEDKIDGIDSKVSKIDGKVANIEGRMGIGYSTASSPVRLTPKGEAMLVESGVKEVVDDENNKNRILEKVLTEPKPTNAYDVQERTKEVISAMANDPMFTPIKNYAFQKGIELDVILNVVSIYFRDFVLEKLGFKVEDVDNH